MLSINTWEKLNSTLCFSVCAQNLSMEYMCQRKLLDVQKYQKMKKVFTNQVKYLLKQW